MRKKVGNRGKTTINRLLSSISKYVLCFIIKRLQETAIVISKMKNEVIRYYLSSRRWLGSRRLLSVTFQPSGFLKAITPSVDDILGLLPPAETQFDNFSDEVIREEEPRWAAMVPPQFVSLPCEIVNESGITQILTQDTLLYIRPRCYQQLLFMKEFVIRQGRIGRIHGHPGTGKSTTGLYFAIDMAVRKKWNVLWVHVRRTRFICLHMKPDGSTATAQMTKTEEFERFLEFFHEAAESASPGHLILIDGLDGKKDDHVITTADNWCGMDRHNRRLVLLSSDGMDEKSFNDQNATYGDQAVFRQWSWKLEEYRIAMSDSRFHASVEQFMDAPRNDIKDPADAKFYYAGGCARYMFHFPTRTVIRRIDSGLEDQMNAALKNRDDCLSIASVHRLFSWYGKGHYDIVSEYAQRQMEEELGTNALVRLAQHSLIKNNRSAVGTLVLQTNRIRHETNSIETACTVRY
jgi:hypothetical protein